MRNALIALLVAVGLGGIYGVLQVSTFPQGSVSLTQQPATGDSLSRMSLPHPGTEPLPQPHRVSGLANSEQNPVAPEVHVPLTDDSRRIADVEEQVSRLLVRLDGLASKEIVDTEARSLSRETASLGREIQRDIEHLRAAHESDAKNIRDEFTRTFESTKLFISMIGLSNIGVAVIAAFKKS